MPADHKSGLAGIHGGLRGAPDRAPLPPVSDARAGKVERMLGWAHVAMALLIAPMASVFGPAFWFMSLPFVSVQCQPFLNVTELLVANMLVDLRAIRLGVKSD